MVLGGAPSHPQHPVAGCWLSQKSSSWKWPWASSAGCPAQRCATQISAAVRPNPTPCASCHGAEIETLLATCFFLLVICLFFFFFPLCRRPWAPSSEVGAVGCSRGVPQPPPATSCLAPGGCGLWGRIQLLSRCSASHRCPPAPACSKSFPHSGPALGSTIPRCQLFRGREQVFWVLEGPALFGRAERDPPSPGCGCWLRGVDARGLGARLLPHRGAQILGSVTLA